MKGFLYATALAAFSVFIATSSVAQVPPPPVQEHDPPMLRHPARDRAPGGIHLQDDATSPTLAAFLSQPFEANAKIRLAMLIVHGAGRDAKPAFESASQMVAVANVPKDAVLIIAPQFLNQYDSATNGDGTKALYWNGIDWIFSEKALNGTVSSYGAVDRIVALLSDRKRFPALQRITIVGHSAGGQFVQRYAMVGRATDELSHTGLDLRYIVANPSSYVYPVAGDHDKRSPRDVRSTTSGATAWTISRPISASDPRPRSFVPISS